MNQCPEGTDTLTIVEFVSEDIFRFFWSLSNEAGGRCNVMSVHDFHGNVFVNIQRTRSSDSY